MEGFLSAERSEAATLKGDDGSIKSEEAATVSTNEVMSSTSTDRGVTQSTSTELTPEEKVARARELLEKKRDAKKAEEEQVHDINLIGQNCKLIPYSCCMLITGSKQ